MSTCARPIAAVAFTLVLAAAATAAAQVTAAAAPLVFTGRVVKIGDVSFADVPRSDRTIVVSIVSVVDKPDAVSLKKDDTVTVEALDPSAFTVGHVYRIAATGWIFGAGLAVREVSHEGAEGKAAMSPADSRLASQIDNADSIVVGKVVQVRDAPVIAGRDDAPVSEHEGLWKEAVVEVSNTIKGTVADKQVVIRFPASNDVAFRDVPHFSVGQSGTFLMHQPVAGRALQLPDARTFEMIKRTDQLPANAASRVRTLSAVAGRGGA